MRYCSVVVLVMMTLFFTCLGSRDLLIRCFQQLIDTNRDNILTIRELDEFLSNRAGECGVPAGVLAHLSGKLILNTCDLNGDGRLSMIDWSQQHACLTTGVGRVRFFSKMCEKCLVQ